jgi:glycosyltransferase involved in cell wall biosynthesis
LAHAGVTLHGELRLDDPGGRERMRELFSTATCFVMPSLIEPSAISYVEAAAAGLPSVCGTVGGSGFLVGAGGLAVDPRSDEALFEAMLHMADPIHARSMGERALERSELFRWPRVAERLVTALRGSPARQGEWSVV